MLHYVKITADGIEGDVGVRLTPTARTSDQMICPGESCQAPRNGGGMAQGSAITQRYLQGISVFLRSEATPRQPFEIVAVVELTA
ncbi:MAG: hypothetical protein Q9187_000247 [Circinaria calcarea]